LGRKRLGNGLTAMLGIEASNRGEVNGSVLEGHEREQARQRQWKVRQKSDWGLPSSLTSGRKAGKG